MIRTRTDKASDDLGTSVISVFSQTHNSEFLGGKKQRKLLLNPEFLLGKFPQETIKDKLIHLYYIYIYILN